MPHHARATMWTVEGQRRWFARCDQCHRWRLIGWYYEVYPPIGSEGKAAGWWYACTDCLVDTLSDRLAATQQERDEIMASYQEQKQRADVAEEERDAMHCDIRTLVADRAAAEGE